MEDEMSDDGSSQHDRDPVTGKKVNIHNYVNNSQSQCKT